MGTPRRALVLIAVALCGCAGQGVQLFTHPNPASPSLTGKTVAVLHPTTVGVEQGTSIMAAATLDAVFSEPLAGIRFLPPREVSARSSLSEEQSAEISRRMGAHLPIAVGPKRLKTRLFSGDRVGDTQLASKVSVTIQRDPSATRWISPDSLPPELFGAIEADLVLVTVAFSTYRRVDRTAALMGILPLAWTRDSSADGPRCLFALYDVKTGARIWDVIVGVGELARGDQATKYIDQPFDPRIMPVVGAAYLLSREFDVPFERALRPRPVD